jgi:CBS domain-containing protein
MKVQDVMSTDVVTVRPETPLKEVAQLLAARRISGVPVVSAEGEVVGVISEADLLVKEGGLTASRGFLLSWFHDSRDHDDGAKLGARLAGEAMTSPAITIAPYRSTTAAAQQMLGHGVNRLPVVRDGSLVGIVSRADLVRAFARSDREVADEVREQVGFFVSLGDDTGDFSAVTVNVDGGEVRLSGTVRRRTTAEALPEHVARIAGVVGVTSEVDWREDDTRYERTPLFERAGSLGL